MKVICIDDRFQYITPPKTGLPKMGEVYTVVKTIESVRMSGVFLYILAEFWHNDAFETCMFAPLSSIDETELLEQRQTQYA